jgi:hypothetical protein
MEPGTVCEDQRPDHCRMTVGDVEHDRAPTRVADQVSGSEVKPSNKRGKIVGMLEDRKTFAASVPRLGEVVAKADRDNAILRAKYLDLGIPVSIVIHRPMHQDERCSASAFAVGHRISIHF